MKSPAPPPHTDKLREQSVIGALERASWEVAVLQELSTPGVAQFLAIRDSSNDVVDFLCSCASPTVARLFGELSGDVVGRRLGEMSAAEVDVADLFLAYVEVLQSGSSFSYRRLPLENDTGSSVHQRIVRLSSDELGVVITDSEAVEKALVAREQLLALQAK